MTPLEARQRASQYEHENPTSSVHASFIQGFLFAMELYKITDASILSSSHVSCPSSPVPPLSSPVPPLSSPVSCNSLQDDDFSTAWTLYDRKDNKQSALKAWRKLSHTERVRALSHIPLFVRAHPDKKFRPMLATYINQKRFLDEEIISNEQSTINPTQERLSAYADAIRNVGRQG